MKRVVFWSLWLFILTIPLENMVVIEGLGTINRLVGLVCIALALVSVLLRQELKTPGGVLILFFVFALWNMTTFFWAIDPENSKKMIFTSVQLFGFVWLVWEFTDGETDQCRLMTAYVLGACGAILSMFYLFFQGIQVTYFRYSAYGFDPNDIGLTLALGIPFAWWLAMKQKGLFLPFLYYLYLPFAFYAIVLTASRAAFLAALTASLFVVWSFPKLHWVRKVMLLTIVIVSVVAILNVVPDYSLERLSTISADLAQGNLNAREYIWWNGLKVFSENPILGVGAGSFGASVEKFTGAEYSPHNLFLSILVDQGMIGFILFMAILYAAVRKIVLMPALQTSLWVFMLLTWFVGVMTLSWAYSKPTWFLIALLASQGALFEKNNGVSKECSGGFCSTYD